MVDEALVKITFIQILLLMCALIASAAVVRADVITIMAANLTSGSQQNYEEEGIRIFQGLRPDIVLIQEFNVAGDDLRGFVDEAFGPEYFYYVEHGNQPIPNGIISRFPFIRTGQWDDLYVYDRDFAYAVIDIPGAIDLQVVSVHLRTDEPNTRQAQAEALENYIDNYFDPNHYIAVGGDLNTVTRNEACVDVFERFLEPKEHIPSDQRLNAHTNESRNKPYDWVMPNHLLEDTHTDLIIGSNTFRNGMVFDSHVYTPLNEVEPIDYHDSHVSGMQHMAVMKAFNVGSGTPPPRTATPTPTRTPTPGPGTSTPTLTPTPTPQATPTCGELGCVIDMPSHEFRAGDVCSCWVTVCNPSDRYYVGVPLFVLLDVFGSYYFAPSFAGFETFESLSLGPGQQEFQVVPEFYWPAGTGIASGICWYAAMTDPGVTQLFGSLGTFTFGWR